VIITPGFLGFVTINGVRGFMIDKVSCPAGRCPGPDQRRRQRLRDRRRLLEPDRIENELPNFELPHLTMPEITFPSQKVKVVPGGGSLTGINYKGFFTPSSEVDGYTVSNNQPG